MNIVILAGGLGTRLKSVVSDLPKPMAPIDGVPFLELLMRELAFLDPERFILCVSHLREKIEGHFKDSFMGIPVAYSVETEPLGTGGAIKRAFDLFNLREALVLNGDSYIRADYAAFLKTGESEKLSILLKRAENANRYGRVEVQSGRAVMFHEKEPGEKPGLINAGIYKIRRELFAADLPEKFSIEKDVLEPLVSAIKPPYMVADDYFIDIGLPESYARAQKELKGVILGRRLGKALFLDRDGVINEDVRYKRYRGSIPFDGTSLIREIHKCGVVLALSSDYHYRAGSATNRIYEACAGGAITISDTNRFIVKHFGDSVLYIDFDKKDFKKMFEQIRRHLDWIKSHPAEALEKAKKAQQIFIEKFSLEKQLSDIIANHGNRQEAAARALCAKNAEAKTLAVLFMDAVKMGDFETRVLNNAIENIERQKRANITLAICCDAKLEKEVAARAKRSSADVRVMPFKFFDDFSNKELSRGQAFRRVVSEIPHEYLVLLDGSENLFSTHITTLVRTLEDAHDCAAAHSANFFDDSDGMRSLRLRDPLHKEDIYECFSKNNYDHVSGMFLFRAETEKLIPAEADRYLDIYLPYALLNLIIFNGNSKAKYSRLITAGKVEDLCAGFPAVMGASMEINFVQGLAREGYEEWASLYPKSLAVGGGIMMDSERDWLSHVYKRKMKLELLWHRLRRLLFAFFPAKRKKAEERIKERKRIIKSLY